MTRKTTDNITYKKLVDQCVHEALCFMASSVMSDSFVLRNRQLPLAADRYLPLNLDEYYL